MTGMSANAIKTLLSASRDPDVIAALKEVELASMQADSMALRTEFEVAWAYEMARARNHPGQPLTPKQVLQLVAETAI